MSAGRFFVPPAILVDPAHVVLPPLIAAQVRTVLRLRVGDAITLLDGLGMAATVRLDRIDRAGVGGTVIDQYAVTTEPRARITLYVGMLKAAKFEWVLQKGTELGVVAFVPLVTARTTSGLDEAGPGKLARWQTIVAEAAEQSERGIIPTIGSPQPFAAALAARPADALGLLAWEDRADTARHPVIALIAERSLSDSSSPKTVAHVGRTLHDHGINYHLFVGPEGGFDPAEVAAARAAGIQAVTLGPRILRAETAAIALATLALAALGELG